MVAIQILSIPFGLKLSPTILNAILQKHLVQYVISEPEIHKPVLQLLNVDDFTGDVTNDEESIQMYQATNRS